MISIASSTRIFVATSPTDMRKGFNGLQGLVSDALGQDPLSGHLFLFVNRRRDKLKVLYWDGDGLAIWYRRLEQGTFQMPTITGDKTAAEINREDLIMLIRGLDYEQVQRRKRFQLKNSPATKVDQLVAT
jgi:transposase